jgi:hypothetical protein
MNAIVKPIIGGYFKITLELARLGEWEAVADISEELVSCLPKNLTTLWNLNQVQAKLGWYPKAIETLKKIRQLDAEGQLEKGRVTYLDDELWDLNQAEFITPKKFNPLAGMSSSMRRELRALSKATANQARSHASQGHEQTEIRALCVVFYRNALHIAEALKHFGWCDVFYCENTNEVNPEGTMGGISGLNRLNIDYSKYNVCLSFNDTMLPTPTSGLKEHFLRCVENGLPVIGNQHGYDKSVIDLLRYVPNQFTYQWNAQGQYCLDRLDMLQPSKTTERVSSLLRWISLGSLKNDYLYRTTRWAPDKTNGKILLLHEPDTDECEQDPNPLKPSSATKEVVECLLKSGIDFDFKLHPSWPKFIGNEGDLLWKPPEEVRLVDCGLRDMANYEAVVGCYSTTLLDAASMGIPVINVEFDYPSQNGAHWGPGEMKLFPRVPARDVVDLFRGFKGKEMRYDYELLKYFLGPLGYVNENYQEYLRIILEEQSGDPVK